MTEKQKKLLQGKEDKERPCFTLATVMRQIFNVIERSFWLEGTGTKNSNYFSGSLCSREFNLISFIAFYSAKKDLSMTLNICLIIIAKVKQGFSLFCFPSNNFFCFSFIPAPTNYQWIFYIPFCGCKVETTMNLLYLSIVEKLTI